MWSSSSAWWVWHWVFRVQFTDSHRFAGLPSDFVVIAGLFAEAGVVTVRMLRTDDDADADDDHDVGVGDGDGDDGRVEGEDQHNDADDN